MTNPYDHNPYATDDRTIRSEADANRALKESKMISREEYLQKQADFQKAVIDKFGAYSTELGRLYRFSQAIEAEETDLDYPIIDHD